MTDTTEVNPQRPVIWVRPDSNVQSTAGLITTSISDVERVTLRAIGAGAVNQALKGIISARQQLSAQGYDLIIKPGFATVQGHDGSDITAVVFHCLVQ